MRLLQALDAVADRLSADAPWNERPPEPTRVVTRDLKPVTMKTIRNGVQETRTLSGEELRQETEMASRGSVQWTRDEIEAHYETDSPWWPWWRAADATRSFRSPYRDDNTWPDSVTRTLLGAVLEPWDWVGRAGNVLDALLGAEVELSPGEEHAVLMLERLAEVLTAETDGSVRAVARVLARIIVDKGVSVKTEPSQTPQEALFEAFCWYLGVDGTCGWQEQLPRVEALRPQAERWVEKVAALKHVWPSQRTAISALVLHSASPAEIRTQ